MSIQKRKVLQKCIASAVVVLGLLATACPAEGKSASAGKPVPEREKRESISQRENIGIYMKGKDLCYTDGTQEGSGVLVSGLQGLSESPMPQPGANYVGTMGRHITVDADGSRLFFPDSGDNLEYSLSFYDLDRPDSRPTVAAPDLGWGLFYRISEDGNRIAYVNTDGKLCLRKVGSEDSEAFTVSSTPDSQILTTGNLEKVIFVDDHNYLSILYADGTVRKLAGDVTRLVYATPDLSHIYYGKGEYAYGEETLCWRSEYGGKERILTDSWVAEAEWGQCWKGVETGEFYFAEYDNQAGKGYLRYFDGVQTPELIHEMGGLSDGYSGFCKFPEKNVPGYFTGPDGRADEYFFQGAECWPVGEDQFAGFYDNGEKYSLVNEAGEVYTEDSEGRRNVLGTLREDVNSWFLTKDGILCQFFGGNQHSLEIGNAVIENAMGYYYDEKTDIVMYSADMDEGKQTMTLGMYRDGKVMEISPNVRNYMLMDNGNVLYLKDYDLKQARGTLFCYHDGIPEKVEEDVFEMLSGWGERPCWYYYNSGYVFEYFWYYGLDMNAFMFFDSDM